MLNLDWKPLAFIALLFFVLGLTSPGLPLNALFTIGGLLLIASLLVYLRERIRERRLPHELRILRKTRASAERLEFYSETLRSLGWALIIFGFILLGIRVVAIPESGLMRVIDWFPYGLPGLLLIGLGVGAFLTGKSVTTEARRTRIHQTYTHMQASALVKCPKCGNQYTRLLIEKCPNCGEPNPEFQDIWKTKK